MLGARWLGMVAICFVFAACGGHARSNADEPVDEGGTSSRGGVAGSESAGAPLVGEGGSAAERGGSSNLPSGGSAECPSLPPQCSRSHDRVVVDGASLSFPGSHACGACSADCTECEPFCTLPITVVPRCSGLTIKLFVCSSLDGQSSPCLNTVADDPYYVDAEGKRWSVVSFVANDSMDFAQPGQIQASLTLTLTDGVATKLVFVHVQACNTDRLRFLPC